MTFKILTRKDGLSSRSLTRVLSNFGRVEVVEDPLASIPGFCKMCTRAIVKDNQTSAWDMAFLDIELTTTWIVEDDVAGSAKSWGKLFDLCRNNDADLCAIDINPVSGHWHWSHLGKRFPNPRMSFNQVCRISPELIRKVLEFRTANNGFTFHEVLLPSLAASSLDLRGTGLFQNQSFRWRPLVTTAGYGIHHPVKDQNLHHEICHASH